MPPCRVAKLKKLCRIRKYCPQKVSEGIYVSTGIDKLRIHGRNQITTSTNAITSGNRTSTAGCFIHYYGKWLVIRRQHHEIRGGVDSGQLRLIHESKKANAICNT